ncbi:hypothetical protein TWF751_010481 [Orbilia oligospora]|nr:hypothetical protein TWF751_010481 [Orbilia oligospora]
MVSRFGPHRGRDIFRSQKDADFIAHLEFLCINRPGCRLIFDSMLSVQNHLSFEGWFLRLLYPHVRNFSYYTL